MSKQQFFVFTAIILLLMILSLVVVEGSSSPPLSSSKSSHHHDVRRRSGGGETQPQNGGYEIIRDKLIFSGRWRSLTSRLVRMINKKEVDFEIFNQRGKGCALIFAWDSPSKTATLIREYNPGPNKVLHGIAAGLVEADKHGSSYETAARYELEEETKLSGGKWFRLLHEGKSMAMDKYMVSEVVAYLVVDARKVENNPRPLDDEEEIEIVNGVSVEDIMEIIRNGDMNCICAFASLLAIEKLRELGEIGK